MRKGIGYSGCSSFLSRRVDVFIMKKFISTLVLAFIVVVSTNVCSAVGSSYQDSEGIYYWIDNSSYIFFLFGNGQYGMSLAFDLNSIQVVRDDDYGSHISSVGKYSWGTLGGR